MRKPMSGITTDLKARLPVYWDDWKQGLSFRVLSTTFLMYFASIGPAITFASEFQKETENQIGVSEVIFSTGICGVIYSFLAGQPLVIVGVTGPVTIFSITVFNLSKQFGINFLQWYAWICFWAGLMHMILAIVNSCDFLVKYVTRFSCDVFGLLISIIYIYVAGEALYERFHKSGTDTIMLGSSIFSLLLALGTLYTAYSLNMARSWNLFNKSMRGFIEDYATVFSILLFSLIPLIPNLNLLDINKLIVPETFRPTSTDRPWIVDFWNLQIEHIFSAIIPAIFFTILLYFDHNVSSLLAQRKEFNLEKDSAYHWDFFVVGIIIIVCGIFQLPPSHGLIPQAPMHVRALAKIEEHGPHRKEVYKSVVENRLSNLLQSLLIMVTVTDALLFVIGNIPIAVLDGLFLYMGIEGFKGNQLAERTSILFVEKSKRLSACPHKFLITVPFIEIVKFTLIQLVLCIGIFAITESPVAIIFPLFILLLIPLRFLGFKWFFKEEYLDDLDTEHIEDHGVVSNDSGDDGGGEQHAIVGSSGVGVGGVVVPDDSEVVDLEVGGGDKEQQQQLELRQRQSNNLNADLNHGDNVGVVVVGSEESKQGAS